MNLVSVQNIFLEYGNIGVFQPSSRSTLTCNCLTLFSLFEVFIPVIEQQLLSFERPSIALDLDG